MTPFSLLGTGRGREKKLEESNKEQERVSFWKGMCSKKHNKSSCLSTQKNIPLTDTSNIRIFHSLLLRNLNFAGRFFLLVTFCYLNIAFTTV